MTIQTSTLYKSIRFAYPDCVLKCLLPIDVFLHRLHNIEAPQLTCFTKLIERRRHMLEVLHESVQQVEQLCA
jgi:hypothetical protein